MSKLILPGQPGFDAPEPEAALPEVNLNPQHRSALLALSPEDLRRLRQVARRAIIAAGCPPNEATDKECDKYIESIFPETAEKMLKRAVDRKLVE